MSRGLVLGIIGGVVLGLGAFACSPGDDIGEREDPYAGAAELEGESQPISEAPAVAGPVRSRSFLGRTSIANWSGAVSHQSPTEALAELETLMAAHGGETTYANASASSGSLQGRVPHAKFSAFRQAARDAGFTFNSENRSTSDMRGELRRLSERKAVLSRAHLGMRAGEGLDAESLAVVHELLMRERISVTQQLDSYEQQLAGVQINLSISRS